MKTEVNYSRDKLTQLMEQNEEEVNELMSIFIKMIPEMLQELISSAENEDWSTCSNIAHKLKSSMRLWAIDSLEEDVLFIENHGLKGTKTNEVSQKIINLKFQLLLIIDRMKKELDME